MKGKNVCPFKKRIFPEREVGEKKKENPGEVMAKVT